MKHTPGPWDYFVGNANGRGLIRIEAAISSPEAGHHIASMPRGAQSEANARLIAAAPELLAALETIKALPPSANGTVSISIGSDCWHAIRAAIAKATAA